MGNVNNISQFDILLRQDRVDDYGWVAFAVLRDDVWLASFSKKLYPMIP